MCGDDDFLNDKVANTGFLPGGSMIFKFDNLRVADKKDKPLIYISPHRIKPASREIGENASADGEYVRNLLDGLDDELDGK